MSSIPATTFHTLRQVLVGLGFSPAVVGKSIRFSHPAHSTKIVYPIFGEDEEVDLGNLIMTRRVLDELGILTPDGFETRIRQPTVAS